MRFVRNTHLFAFWQGYAEHLDGCGGRTHDSDMGWNEAYDAGMNLADFRRALIDWWAARPWRPTR